MYTILLLLIIYHVYISQKLFFSRSFVSAAPSVLNISFIVVCCGDFYLRYCFCKDTDYP